MGKLLTLASSRDLIEDCVEEQKAARQELREIRAEQHRRGREEAAHRCLNNRAFITMSINKTTRFELKDGTSKGFKGMRPRKCGKLRCVPHQHHRCF